jgi:2-polyprenyl-6-methoxyphenol hydroxylase-like FAD-dependent oxidoreductase
MKNTTVLISGASIGGPAAAYWLHRYGCTVTVVERAPELRRGGQAVDFKGQTHLTVLERMGILDEVRRRETGGADQTIVDADGTPLAVMPGEFSGGDIEIRRGDLAQLLYERTADNCEYLFDDSITSLTESVDGVHVTFERAAPRSFDLVIGADGIHSNVRRLAFGPESAYVKHLDHYYALVDVNLDSEPTMYNEPGRMATLGGPKSPAFLVFASPQLEYDRFDTAQQKKLVMEAYQGGGWRIPEILANIPAARELYLDSISRVSIDQFTKGRVALLGDAGYGNTLGGFGTGLAMVGAYVLAGELAAAGGDHRSGFARYQGVMGEYAKVARRGNAGKFLAPATKLRMKLRDWTFTSNFLLRMMLKMTDDFATNIDLKDYPALHG